MIRANWSGVRLKELSEYVLNINERLSKSHLRGLSVDNIKKRKVWILMKKYQVLPQSEITWNLVL